MNKSMKRIALGVSSLLAAGAVAAALAGQSDGRNDNDDRNPNLVNEVVIGVDQAISIALADIPGKIIEAEIELENGVTVWEIEVLDESNQVFEFEIDANTGEILEKELDND